MTLRCSCWIPSDREEDVREALRRRGDEEGDEQVGEVVSLRRKSA